MRLSGLFNPVIYLATFAASAAPTLSDNKAQAQEEKPVGYKTIDTYAAAQALVELAKPYPLDESDIRPISHADIPDYNEKIPHIKELLALKEQAITNGLIPKDSKLNPVWWCRENAKDFFGLLMKIEKNDAEFRAPAKLINSLLNSKSPLLSSILLELFHQEQLTEQQCLNFTEQANKTLFGDVTVFVLPKGPTTQEMYFFLDTIFPQIAKVIGKEEIPRTAPVEYEDNIPQREPHAIAEKRFYRYIELLTNGALFNSISDPAEAPIASQ